MLRIWKRVDPKMTKRKMPNSQGPTEVDSSFFYIRTSVYISGSLGRVKTFLRMLLTLLSHFLVIRLY